MERSGAVYIDPADIPLLDDLGKDRPRLLFGLCGRRTFPLPVAVVGSRRPDWYGELMAGFLGEAIARAGGTVISGGALGIDSLAHQGCMEANGPTVVVFAGGLARPTPPSNRDMFRRIAQDGCIITETPPLVEAKAYSFTSRNRIIAALGLGTIVVQATSVSGSLVTGRWALRMDRPVLAVPGDVVFQDAAGTNQLLQEGAVPLTGPGVLDASLGLKTKDWPMATRRPARGKPVIKEASKPTKGQTTGLEGAELEVYKAIQAGAWDVDTIVEKTELTASQVLSVVSSLELKGVTQRLGGGRFAPVEDSDLFA